MNQDVDAAVARAASKLSRSDKLSCEIISDLAGKGFDSDVIQIAITRLIQAGVVNDARVVNRRVALAVAAGKSSRSGIATKLKAVGALPEQIHDALEEHFPLGLEAQIIRNILQKKYHDQEDVHRAGRYLSSLGFEPDLIETELSKYFVSHGP